MCNRLSNIRLEATQLECIDSDHLAPMIRFTRTTSERKYRIKTEARESRIQNIVDQLPKPSELYVYQNIDSGLLGGVMITWYME